MKKYFVAGLLIWLPLAITFWVLHFLITSMDQTLLLLPEAWRPSAWLGFNPPGAGVFIALLTIFLTGVAATNYVGHKLLQLWEAIVARIPVVKSIYSSVKQISDTLLKSEGEAFRKVVLVRFPHADSWMIAFQTAMPGPDVTESLQGHLQEECIGVYVPTTPNPTSGYYLLMRRSDVIELSMSVDVALKYIISMGAVSGDLRVRGAVKPPVDAPAP